MNGIIVRGRVEIWSILKVCDSDDRLLSVTHQQGAGGACLRNETKVKALNPFVSERACTWHFTLIASQIQLGNKRHKCNILKQPAHSSWKAPVASSLATLAGSRWCWGGLPWAVPLIYPFLPACYKVEANPECILWKEIIPHQIHMTNVYLEHRYSLPWCSCSWLLHTNNDGSRLNGIQGDNFTELN